MLDKQKLIEIYKQVLEWLTLAWHWLDQKAESLFHTAADDNAAPKSDADSREKKPSRLLLYFLLGVFVLSMLSSGESMQGKEIPYSQFLTLVNDNKIDQAVVTQRFINGSLKVADAKVGKQFYTIPLWDAGLVKTLQEHQVQYVVRSGENWLNTLIFTWIIPIAIFAGIWLWLLPRMGGGAGRSFLNLGNKMHIKQETAKNTFDDVAGAESAKQELKETIDFLIAPEKLKKLGGRMPKGVLLVGAPGTGKTLLARAVSGEAGVPFLNISASEFIELFVGVGAARVRELFEQARKIAPCIIFIDELDAIGRARGGAAMMGGNDEREQTLNQLLTEMDGFDPTSGVVVMAATNRPEILDKALLRAGRFDRQIVVDKPDLIDRIMAGPEKKNRILGPDEKRRVAYHEAGHALVAEAVPFGQPVHKISIIPRGVSSLGFTLQLPVEEKYLSTEPELKDQLAILLGGRVAEQLALNSVSTGAQNDLEKASEIARNMVCYLGMSKKLGPLIYGQRQQLQFLGGEYSEQRNYSEETARLVDSEIRQLIEDAQLRAHKVLTANRQHLDQLAELLQEKEVISREEMLALLADKP